MSVTTQATHERGGIHPARSTTSRKIARQLSGVVLLAFAHLANAQAPDLKSASESNKSTAQMRTHASGSRIEVSGNKVTDVRCGDGGAVSINSVNVNGANLKGRTVIIQNQSEDSAKAIECTDPPNRGGAAPTHINSITIR